MVESYHGPAERAELVRGQAPVEPAELAERAAQLSDGLSQTELEPDRLRWLAAHLDALAVVFQRLAGKDFRYRELTERCHGVTPTLVADEQFAEAHELLDGALPGNGELPGRYQAWMESQRVARDVLLEGLLAGS